LKKREPTRDVASNSSTAFFDSWSDHRRVNGKWRSFSPVTDPRPGKQAPAAEHHMSIRNFGRTSCAEPLQIN
jgi:hypothetical protein